MKKHRTDLPHGQFLAQNGGGTAVLWVVEEVADLAAGTGLVGGPGLRFEGVLCVLGVGGRWVAFLVAMELDVLVWTGGFVEEGSELLWVVR